MQPEEMGPVAMHGYIVQFQVLSSQQASGTFQVFIIVVRFDIKFKTMESWRGFRYE